jgi:hypothetical protein
VCRDLTEMKKLGVVEEANLLLTPKKRLWKRKCGVREMSDAATR